MEMVYTALLAVAAFGLAAIPFSVLVGRWFLGREITDYGDGNPGAVNVFRAGGQKLGYLAVFLDVAKGVPFVFLTYHTFDLSELSVVIVAICAVLGHAFSPFLRWQGGKALAVTFGVLLALPQHEMLLAFIAFMVLGFLFGAAGTLAYLGVTRGGSWETFLMLCLLAILAFKHFEALHTFPGFRGRFLRFIQSIIHGAMFTI